jgi:hypothetical protein
MAVHQTKGMHNTIISLSLSLSLCATEMSIFHAGERKSKIRFKSKSKREKIRFESKRERSDSRAREKDQIREKDQNERGRGIITAAASRRELLP